MEEKTTEEKWAEIFNISPKEEGRIKETDLQESFRLMNLSEMTMKIAPPKSVDNLEHRVFKVKSSTSTLQELREHIEELQKDEVSEKIVFIDYQDKNLWSLKEYHELLRKNALKYNLLDFLFTGK